MTLTEAYVAANADGTFDVFVSGRGWRANARLPACLAFIRRATGRSSGAVPCFDRARGEWDSEYDLSEGA